MSCGETSERVAAIMHGVVGVLYAAMLAWHVKSVFTHLKRERA